MSILREEESKTMIVVKGRGRFAFKNLRNINIILYGEGRTAWPLGHLELFPKIPTSRLSQIRLAFICLRISRVLST